jgi:hypothetical protein
MPHVMLIISLATGQVKAMIPYQTLADCVREAPLAYRGNWPNTVKIVCQRAEGV